MTTEQNNQNSTIKKEDNLKEVKCPFCGNIKIFDTTKVPVNVKFDYRCSKCGSFHMIKL